MAVVKRNAWAFRHAGDQSRLIMNRRPVAASGPPPAWYR